MPPGKDRKTNTLPSAVAVIVEVCSTESVLMSPILVLGLPHSPVTKPTDAGFVFIFK